MALSLGTNSGFVSEAPVADPNASSGGWTFDARAKVTKHTSPATATKIVEMGWWCDAETEAADFEVALYAADGATVPGEAGTRLFVSTGNLKGTTAGWKSVAVDWAIDPSTDYWLGASLENTSTTTILDNTGNGGDGEDGITSATLPDPFGGGALHDGNGMWAIYGVWEAGEEEGLSIPIVMHQRQMQRRRHR